MIHFETIIFMKLRHTILTFGFAISFISSYVQAAEFKPTSISDCTNIRLDKAPSPLSKIKMYDMDGLLMCTAYATSYLVDAERLRVDKNTNHLTSPLYLGIQYAKMKHLKNLEIDDALGVPRVVNKLRSCSYNAVSDNLANERYGKYDSYLEALGSAFTSKDTQLASSCLVHSGAGTSESFKQISNYINSDNYVDFVSGLFQDTCKNNEVPLNNLPPMITDNTIKYGANRATALNALQQTFNETLEKGKPIGIDYCAKVLKNPSINGVGNDGHLSTKPDDGCGYPTTHGYEAVGHSSTVVGRRLLKYQKDGKTGYVCQYLVRDVYGTSCSKYPPDKTADPSDTCDKGSVWVDEDAILYNTYATFHF